MPSAITHALVGAAAVQALPPSVPKGRTALLLAAAAAAPDLDVIAFRFGIPYGHVLGHRGLSHSLLGAALVGLLLSLVVRRWSSEGGGRVFLGIWLAAFAAVALHGFLDAATDAGRGIGFFIPFTDHRYFLPFRPIATSSINPVRFFGRHGVRILGSEARWVWLPLALASALFQGLRWWRRRVGPWAVEP